MIEKTLMRTGMVMETFTLLSGEVSLSIGDPIIASRVGVGGGLL